MSHGLEGFFLICVVDFFFFVLKLKRHLVNVTPADGPTQRTHGEVQSEGSKIPTTFSRCRSLVSITSAETRRFASPVLVFVRTPSCGISKPPLWVWLYGEGEKKSTRKLILAV